jgi:hypothetical protein
VTDANAKESTVTATWKRVVIGGATLALALARSVAGAASAQSGYALERN